MLRLITPIIVLSTLVGCCCNHPQPTPAPSPTTQQAATPLYRDPSYGYPASALVFDPPVAYGQPALDLSRDGRQPMAFAGFQQGSTTFTTIVTDDRQSTFCPDSYSRCSFTVQVGTGVR